MTARPARKRSIRDRRAPPATTAAAAPRPARDRTALHHRLAILRSGRARSDRAPSRSALRTTSVDGSPDARQHGEATRRAHRGLRASRTRELARALDDFDRTAVFEEQRRRRRAVMRQGHVDTALIEKTDERKVRARCRLDVMDRASGLPASKKTQCALSRSASVPATSSGRFALETSHGTTRNGITSRAIVSSIDATRDCSTGIGQPEVQHRPLWRQAYGRWKFSQKNFTDYLRWHNSGRRAGRTPFDPEGASSAGRRRESVSSAGASRARRRAG